MIEEVREGAWLFPSLLFKNEWQNVSPSPISCIIILKKFIIITPFQRQEEFNLDENVSLP